MEGGHNRSLGARRMTQAMASESQKKLSNNIGVTVVTKRINPLPPIEQYQLYNSTMMSNTGNNFASGAQTMPVKNKFKGVAKVEINSGISDKKRERDALVNELYANKKQLRKMDEIKIEI